MYKVGDKVKIKRTNTVHEIEALVSWNKVRLKGLSFTFLISELKPVEENTNYSIYESLIKEIENQSKKEWLENFQSFVNQPVRLIEPIKTVRANEILRIGGRMRIKGNKHIYEIEAIYKDNYFELLGKDGIFHISELEIVPKTNDKHLKQVKEYKCNYISINGFKKGDIVENDGLLFEIVELNAAMPFKLKPISEGFYVEFDPNELKHANQLESFSFIAIWQKEREFYLIEHKGGEFSRMDKPEFEEYCEKMDKLNVKYKVIL